MSVYDVGDQVHIEVTFKNLSGVAVNPTQVAFRVKTPGGSTTTYTYGTSQEVTTSATGIYALDLPLTEAGTYSWKCNGTGALIASDQGYIEVRKSLA